MLFRSEGGAVDVVGLELDVHHPVARPEVENLVEEAEPRAAQITATEVGPGGRSDAKHLAGEAGERGIVAADHLPGGAESHVELDPVGSRAERRGEGREGVLRRLSRGAAVTEDEHDREESARRAGRSSPGYAPGAAQKVSAAQRRETQAPPRHS